MVERTRSGATGVDESVVPDVRQYDEKAVAAILTRAAELDRKRREQGTALTLAEIEQIARDAGMDPAVIRQAARDVDQGGQGSTSNRLAGAPMRTVHERVLDRELTVADHEALMPLIQQALAPIISVPAQVSTVGRSLMVSARSGRGTVEVQVSPQGTRTLIRVSANAGPMAGGLFGGIMGGVGGGLGTNVCAGLVAWASESAHLTPGLAALTGIAGLLGVVGGAYSLARAIFSRSARKLHGSMEDLADRLEATLKG
jgi:hypothetical protein